MSLEKFLGACECQVEFFPPAEFVEFVCVGLLTHKFERIWTCLTVEEHRRTRLWI